MLDYTKTMEETRDMTVHDNLRLEYLLSPYYFTLGIPRLPLQRQTNKPNDLAALTSFQKYKKNTWHLCTVEYDWRICYNLCETKPYKITSVRAWVTINTWITVYFFLQQKTYLRGLCHVFPFSVPVPNIEKEQIGFVLSCYALRGSFDFHGCPFLLSSIFSNKGSVLVKLSILIAIVHNAVPTVPSL